jgi:2-amino-4-hydroxy-6-hydroxymethyldihydropteridine diphosphokinase
MFDYYIVLGGSLDPYRHLENAIAMLTASGDVMRCSKHYVGPSEAPNIHHSFMNVALQLRSGHGIEAMRGAIKRIEARQLNQGSKVIDIDLILQMEGDHCHYQSSKINYCHVLITLKDVVVRPCKLRQTILKKYTENPNAHVFLPITIGSL